MLGFLAVPSWGTTHFVSNTGSNTYPYTSWATATDSLRAAIEAAQEWDTVLVAAGSYTCDSLPLKKGMVFQGAGMDSTYVRHNGTYYGLLVLADSSVTRGFHFDGRIDTGFGGTLNYRLGNGVTARANVGAVFTNNRLTNIEHAIDLLFNSQSVPTRLVHVDSNEIGAFYQAIYAIGTSTRITNNTFRIQHESIASTINQLFKNAEITGNRFIMMNVEFNGSATVDLSPIDTAVVRNNLFITDSIGRSLAIYLNHAQPGRIAEGELSNNTIVGGWDGIQTGDGNALVRNNIFAMIRRIDLGPSYTGDTLVQYNAFWRTQYGWPKDTADFEARHNIFLDPMLAESLDYVLEAFSPAIDAGDPSIVDRDGSRSDMGYAGGQGGFTYNYQDLPPLAPSALAARNVSSGIQLVWPASTESDFGSYRIYRDTGPILSPSVGLRLATVLVDTLYVDRTADPPTVYYYRITAVDHQTHESALSPEVFLASSGVGEDPIIPARLVVGRSYPNPFNSIVSIPISVPGVANGGGRNVEISIISTGGQKVRILHRGHLAPGEHTFHWNGADAREALSASGVYVVRVIADGESHSQKVTLLK